MAKRKILIIDDEETFCKLLKMNLELDGYCEMSFALNGREGFKLAKKLKPDLILLDLIMPGIDGIAVLEKLKKDEETIQIPVVMLTALDNEESKLKALQSYNDLYLTKPIETSVLKERIEEVLRRKRF